MSRNILIMGIVILLLFLVSSPVSALTFESGESVIIDTPVDDDIFASAEHMEVTAPVKSLVYAGNSLLVTAPIETNLIAVGESISVQAPVGVDLIAAGANVQIGGDIGGKIIAAGEQVTVDGSADNLIAAGNRVALGENAHIRKDAEVSADAIEKEGIVDGTWNAEDTGLSFPGMEQLGALIQAFVLLCIIFIAIGFFLLGLVIIYLMPEPWKELTSVPRTKPLHVLLYGLATVVVSVFLVILLALTVIGIPFALLILLFLGIATIIAPLIISGSLGGWISGLCKREISPYLAYLIGFIIICVLSLVPIIGFVCILIVLLMGIGTIVRTMYHKKETCCSR